MELAEARGAAAVPVPVLCWPAKATSSSSSGVARTTTRWGRYRKTILAPRCAVRQWDGSLYLYRYLLRSKAKESGLISIFSYGSISWNRFNRIEYRFSSWVIDDSLRSGVSLQHLCAPPKKPGNPPALENTRGLALRIGGFRQSCDMTTGRIRREELSNEGP